MLTLIFTYYVPGIILDAGDKAINKTGIIPLNPLNKLCESGASVYLYSHIRNLKCREGVQFSHFPGGSRGNRIGMQTTLTPPPLHHSHPLPQFVILSTEWPIRHQHCHQELAVLASVTAHDAGRVGIFL